jgi:hypothetical protein
MVAAMSGLIRRMVFVPRFAAAGWLALAGVSPLVSANSGEGPAFTVERQLKPFFSTYCYQCHGKERQRAEIDFERLPASADFAQHQELWEKVRKALESREMPPDDRPQPPEEERHAIVTGIANELERLDAASPPQPGAVTARRLNRNEYRNTVRDLLGVDYNTHATFPHDESGYGFDNIGDVLSLPPMLLEKYLAAAEEIAAKVIVTEDPALKRIRRVPADRFSSGSEEAARREDEDVWGLYREAEIVARHDFKEPGDYLLRLTAFGEQAGPELPKMAVRLDGKGLHVQSVRAMAGRAETFDVPIRVEAGEHRLGVAYLNNFNSDGDRNLFMTRFEVVGPLNVPPEEYPEPHRRILPRRAKAGQELDYAAEVLRRLASRAYRRPARDNEVRRLVRFVEMALAEGENFERGIQLALQAVLVSPHFLYRWELDPRNLPPGESRELNDDELASRLSYFIWSSMPDQTLFELAAKGTLSRPDVLEAEVRRMLRDPKSMSLVRHFGGQWLQIRNLDQAEPDTSIFPEWDLELRDAMRRETELFLRAVIEEDRSIWEMLDADFIFVNERLARHYGIPGIHGEEFQRVNLPAGSVRGGVLTMGSILTVTSVPTRTAPVLRGKWILEQILGTPPPPPPPNLPQLAETAEAVEAASVRQRLELHRSHPDCMPCHQKMDPLGFALENFDGIGAWREQDGPHPIDNAAELPNGRRFAGADGLKEVLREATEFPETLVAKMLTYALGRGLEPYDRRAVREISEALAKNDFKFSALVVGITASEPFLKRQPETSNSEQHASFSP